MSVTTPFEGSYAAAKTFLSWIYEAIVTEKGHCWRNHVGVCSSVIMRSLVPVVVNQVVYMRSPVAIVCVPNEISSIMISGSVGASRVIENGSVMNGLDLGYHKSGKMSCISSILQSSEVML